MNLIMIAKKYWIIIAVVVIIAVLGFVFLPAIIGKIKQGGPASPSQGGPSCSVAPGEWMPERGECPGTTAEKRAQCEEFCEKHPDCCGERGDGEHVFGGREIALPLPSDKEIAKLKRDYPTIIKVLNEGPNIYSRSGEASIIKDEELEEIKSIGFNTIQVLLIGKKENGKLVFNDFNNSVLLNDIAAIKKRGLAVWVALDIAGGPASQKTELGDYSDFKSSFLDFTKKSAELMEKYKVEYFTPNNEPDKPFKEQKNWSATEINSNLADFFPATNAAAREKFKGKLINKITKTQNHAKEVLEASFKNVDIVGVDVGPPMDGKMSLANYKQAFGEYQFFASLAKEKGLPWMNAEYWQGDFGQYSAFAKANEVKYAKISFDAYLKTAPKGVGYTWNDFTTFSLPQGEEMKKALAEFFKNI